MFNKIIAYKSKYPYFNISAKLIASSIPGIAPASSLNKLSIPSELLISSCSTVGSTSYETDHHNTTNYTNQSQIKGFNYSPQLTKFNSFR